MTEMSRKGSFVQYERCGICRISYKRFRKHVYSTKHREVLDNIIKKLSKKVEEAKTCLSSPEITDRGWEQGAHFWCYFCVEEATKHEQLENVTVKHLGLLKHISQASHATKTQKFWKDHRIENKDSTGFILEQDELEEFKVKCEVAVRTYLAQKHEELKKATMRLRHQEIQRSMVAHSYTHMLAQGNGSLKHHRHTSGDAHHSITTWSNSQQDRPAMIRTEAAKGEGLTFVGVKHFDPLVGNIHSGAAPPWLESDVSHQSSTIGPTMEDFQKHLAGERKKKLPAHRVGAKFDHKEETEANWLPSFGRVWSNSRRSQARGHFMKNISHPYSDSKKNTTSLTSTSSQAYHPSPSESQVQQQHHGQDPNLPNNGHPSQYPNRMTYLASGSDAFTSESHHSSIQPYIGRAQDSSQSVMVTNSEYGRGIPYAGSLEYQPRNTTGSHDPIKIASNLL